MLRWRGSRATGAGRSLDGGCAVPLEARRRSIIAIDAPDKAMACERPRLRADDHVKVATERGGCGACGRTRHVTADASEPGSHQATERCAPGEQALPHRRSVRAAPRVPARRRRLTHRRSGRGVSRRRHPNGSCHGAERERCLTRAPGRAVPKGGRGARDRRAIEPCEPQAIVAALTRRPRDGGSAGTSDFIGHRDMSLPVASI